MNISKIDYSLDFIFISIIFDLFQTTASDQTRVVIEDVQINYSGSYMCEVTVSPTFDALIQFANMTVVGK